jgi:hypothetical protein
VEFTRARRANQLAFSVLRSTPFVQPSGQKFYFVFFGNIDLLSLVSLRTLVASRVSQIEHEPISARPMLTRDDTLSSKSEAC